MNASRTRSPVTRPLTSLGAVGFLNPLHMVPPPHPSLLPVHPSFWLLSLTARIVPTLQRWRLHCECIALITLLHLGPRKHPPSPSGLAGATLPGSVLPPALWFILKSVSIQLPRHAFTHYGSIMSVFLVGFPPSNCNLLPNSFLLQSSQRRFVLSTETNPELP